MAGVGAISTQDRKKWTYPSRQKVPSAAATPEGGAENKMLGMEGYSPLAKSVTDQMMSGAAFDPYRKMSQEAMARREANKRAAAAGRISRGGMAQQGMGRQITAGTEESLGRQRYDTMLQTEMAAQKMKEQGVGMYQRGRAGESDIAYRQAGLDIQERGL